METMQEQLDAKSEEITKLVADKASLVEQCEDLSLQVQELLQSEEQARNAGSAWENALSKVVARTA